MKGAIVKMPVSLVKGKSIRFAEKDRVISDIKFREGVAEIPLPEFSIYTALIIE